MVLRATSKYILGLLHRSVEEARRLVWTGEYRGSKLNEICGSDIQLGILQTHSCVNQFLPLSDAGMSRKPSLLSFICNLFGMRVNIEHSRIIVSVRVIPTTGSC